MKKTLKIVSLLLIFGTCSFLISIIIAKQYFTQMAVHKAQKIISSASKNEDKPLYLGKIDEQDRDVYTAGAHHNMTPFWHYMGHKYDRSWIRTLRASEDIKLEITLTSPVEEGIITSSPLPIINGNKMTWTLKKGDHITFTDGNAQISWKRLNSYIGVDQISILPF